MLNLLKETCVNLPYLLAGGYAFPPTNLTFELTYNCNLNCRICYLRNTGVRNYINRNKELTLAEIKNVLKILTFKIPFTQKKLPHILFTGGEIFLRKDIMDILTFASQRASLSILTNGTLLSDSIIKALIDLNVELILFSLDGPEGIHDIARNKKGSFDETVANIEKIARLKKIKGRKKPIIQINAVISEINAGALAELLPVAERIGADELVFAGMDLSSCRWLGGGITVNKDEYLRPPPKMKFNKLDSLKESLDKIEKECTKKGFRIVLRPYGISQEVIKYYANKLDIRNYTCRYPWRTMRISAYGDIFPCYRLKIGNLREDGLRKLSRIWNGKAYRRFRRTLKRDGLFPGCIGCGSLIRKPATQPSRYKPTNPE